MLCLDLLLTAHSYGLSIGQEIVGVVTSLDEQKGKCAISTKKIEAYPGEMLVNATNVFANAANTLDR